MRNCAKWFTWAQVIWNHLRYLLALDYKSIYFHHEIVSFYRLMSFPLLSWHSCTISGHFISLICINSRKFFLLCTFLCFWHPSFLFYLPFPLILNVAGRTAYSMWLWRWSDLDLNTNLQFTHYMTLGQWCTFLSFFFFFLICKRMFAMDVSCLCCLISVLLSFVTGTQFSFENPPADTQAWCFARVGGTEVILFLSRGARVIPACPGSNGHCCRI